MKMITSSNPTALVASARLPGLLQSSPPEDVVSARLHESARRIIGIAVFSGVVNVLMLAGSLYMLQVYDRVIPSRSVPTLVGLSLMVLAAYLLQGYFDALRSRMLCRVGTLFDIGL
jgi:ABC-type protease/lipase transport system fused ATPase/permease subunit